MDIQQLNDELKKLNVKNKKGWVQIHPKVNRNEIYDHICSILTMYEEGLADANDLYNILVEVQNNWENIITAQQ